MNNKVQRPNKISIRGNGKSKVLKYPLYLVIEGGGKISYINLVMPKTQRN